MSRYNRNDDRNQNRESERLSRRIGRNRSNENRVVYTGGYPDDFHASYEDAPYFGGGSSGPGYGGGFSSSNIDYDEEYWGGIYHPSDVRGRVDNRNYNRNYDRQDLNWGSARSDYGDYAYEGRLNERGMEEDRGWWDRASDEVSSWFGDEEAERRRRMDRRSHRGKGPKNYTRSDERIHEDVNDRLTENHYLDASDIEVSVSGGEVTLSGTVGSRLNKRWAEDLTDSVSGVKHTQNNLRVKEYKPGSVSYPSLSETTGDKKNQSKTASS